MTWYLQHQRARDIIAAREREARRIQLERLLADRPAPSESGPARVGRARRAVACPVVALGLALTRLGRALDPSETAPVA